MNSEYWSECCIAAPLFDLHIEEYEEVMGICSHCRDNTLFKRMEDEDE